MPVVVPLIAAGVTAAGSAAAGKMGADAQQNIATAQAQQAAQNRAAAMAFAAPTTQEIQSIGDRINQQQRYQAVQEAGLARDQQILGSLDPALVQAGKQAQQLMSGQQASILAPMKQQQQFERNQLQQKLAAQLGPGFETSSAGQAALQQFDMQSNLQTQQAQMSAFNQVSQFLNYGIQSSNAINTSNRLGFETGSQMSAQTLQAMGNIQSRQANASIGTGSALTSTAGSQFAGQAASAASLQGLSGAIGQGAGLVAQGAMNLASSGGSSAPSTSTPYTDANFKMPTLGASAGFQQAA